MRLPRAVWKAGWLGRFLAATLLPLAGCWTGRLQTARTVPKGHALLILGDGFIYNELIQERKEGGGAALGFGNFPPHLGIRVGVANRVDVGLVEYNLLGLLADAKVNLLPPSWKLALSLSLGIGGAGDFGWDRKARLLTIPANLAMSYDFLRDSPRHPTLTPYVALGWVGHWLWNYLVGQEDGGPETSPNEGDHLLQATGGLAIQATKSIWVYIEYDYFHQFHDDPEDRHAFVDNHVFLVGFSLEVDLWELFGSSSRPKPASKPSPSTLPPPPPPPIRPAARPGASPLPTPGDREPLPPPPDAADATAPAEPAPGLPPAPRESTGSRPGQQESR